MGSGAYGQQIKKSIRAMAAPSATTAAINNKPMTEAIPSQTSSSTATTAPTSADVVMVTRQHRDGTTVNNSMNDGNRNCSGSSLTTHVSNIENSNNTAESGGSVAIIANPTDMVSKADRLKDIELIESYFLGVPSAVVRNAQDTNTAAEHHNGFSTMEILHEHLLQPNSTSDDERLLNLIIQPSQAIPTANIDSHTLWEQASFERPATDGNITATGDFSSLGNIHDQITNVSVTSRPRLFSSLSRQSSITVMEHYSNAFDTSNMNSTAWKPELQKEHQEIPYSPEHIFSDKYGGAGSITTTTKAIDATTSAPSFSLATTDVLPTNTETQVAVDSAATTFDHTAGAETLLLAAQVLHEGTNHNNHENRARSTRRKSRTTEAATSTDAWTNEQGVSVGQKSRLRSLKNQDVVSSQNGAVRQIDVPEGHAFVDEGTIALLIPDADITNHDVLLGRGGRTNHHPGNATYRTYKEQLQDEYLRAAKDAKTCISNRLVQMIHERHGRFLKAYEPEKDQSSKKSKTKDYRKDTNGFVESWYEVDLLTARKKASQALREINTPENRAAKRAKYSSGK